MKIFTYLCECLQRVLQAYRNEGHKFLFQTFETAKYLEDLTGISEFMRLNSKVSLYTVSYIIIKHIKYIHTYSNSLIKFTNSLFGRS